MAKLMDVTLKNDWYSPEGKLRRRGRQEIPGQYEEFLPSSAVVHDGGKVSKEKTEPKTDEKSKGISL